MEYQAAFLRACYPTDRLGDDVRDLEGYRVRLFTFQFPGTLMGLLEPIAEILMTEGLTDEEFVNRMHEASNNITASTGKLSVHKDGTVMYSTPVPFLKWLKEHKNPGVRVRRKTPTRKGKLQGDSSNKIL